MSDLKIEHFENGIQECTYIITEDGNKQDVCFENDGDYKAITQLRQRIAELEAGLKHIAAQKAERMEASGHKSLKGFEPYDKRKSIVLPSPD